MAWYEDALFYHIYPLGLTDAPKQNAYTDPQPRLQQLQAWLPHIRSLGCSAIYIGPLFESVGHGYETTDYKKLDSRLGTNTDLTAFVAACHRLGLRVIFDGVFNHTGRDFFAFRDIREKREQSPYRDWYCHVNFGGNNSFGDGFSYQNWGGYDLLAKLNQKNPAMRSYIADVIRFWVSEFDVDGIRLDAADVMDLDFLRFLRRETEAIKPDFWLMGEVIHGDYSRWANPDTLHSVTNYTLHKAFYSAHNDHNYFELAHTLNYVCRQVGDLRKLYTFVDNHDVERIHTILRNKAHFTPVHILLYTLPGIPSLYYGSEFGIEGKKERHSDASLRPALRIEDYADAAQTNPCTALLTALGKLRAAVPALRRGEYRELLLQTGHYAFSRTWEGVSAIVTVNNGSSPVTMTLSAADGEYAGALFGGKAEAKNGQLTVSIPADSGEIWLPAALELHTEPLPPIVAQPAPIPHQSAAVKAQPEAVPKVETPQPETAKPQAISLDLNKPHEEMSIEELQEAILQCMRKNGEVTDYMLRTVRENTHHGSLLNWVRSFR
ncbi:MAG: alpha-amylase [Oscillospiraceae bacterium]|nr:alpha-amylase [Oscillospiraceae bacterium]